MPTQITWLAAALFYLGASLLVALHQGEQVRAYTSCVMILIVLLQVIQTRASALIEVQRLKAEQSDERIRMTMSCAVLDLRPGQIIGGGGLGIYRVRDVGGFGVELQPVDMGREEAIRLGAHLLVIAVALYLVQIAVHWMVFG